MSGPVGRSARTGVLLRALPAAGLVALLATAPRLAEACAVCTAGREEESQWAFILTTIFLSVLPLALIGAIGWAVWRRLRAAEARRVEAEGPGLDPLPSR